MSFIRTITERIELFGIAFSALFGIAVLYFALAIWPPMTASIQQFQGLGQGSAGPISEQTPARQTFKAQGGSLGGVGLVLATGGLGPSDSVKVSIKELENGSSGAEEGRVVARSELPVSRITDWALTIFRLEEVKAKAGAVYAIDITAGPTGQLYIAASKSDAYGDGELYLAGRRQMRDAVFRVYGEPSPSKPFEGIGRGSFQPLADSRYLQLALVLCVALIGATIWISASAACDSSKLDHRADS